MPAVPLGNDVDMPDHAQLLSLAPGDLAQIIVVIDGLEAHALSQVQDIAERPPDLPAERGVFFGGDLHRAEGNQLAQRLQDFTVLFPHKAPLFFFPLYCSVFPKKKQNKTTLFCKYMVE